jgi:hypothetical protein
MLNKSSLLVLLLILNLGVLLVINSCKKNDAESEPYFPELTGISIVGEKTTFDVIVGFNQGVFSNTNSTGDLKIESFKVTSTGGVASIDNFFVTHTAGQKSASIRVVFTGNTNGEEIISVSPFDANSIYNRAGRNMNAAEIKSISTAGVEHKIITLTDNGSGIGTQTWTANNIYLLDGLVFVNEGQVLTIEAGTIIKGKSGQGENASALVIARGGKILAEGTSEKPIIFTAEADDLNGSVSDLDSGLWGGLIILGRAVLNTDPGEQQIEGIPEAEERGIYGGTDDEDDSGILRYISIRHGGTDIGEGDEINGLTLGAVGYNTIIEFVEVFANKDDGIEIFGGAARLSNILVAFCGDDAFDYDQGYHGEGQFWAAIQGFNRGDRLGEHDGGTEPETGQPYAIPTIYNTTYVGLPPGASRRIMTFRANAGGHFANSIFYQQAFGIDIELLTGECSYTRFVNEELTLKNNIFYLIDHEPLLEVSAGSGLTEQEKQNANDVLRAYFNSAENSVYDPGFNLNGLTFNIIPANDVSDNLAAYPMNGWFQAVNYKGAFDPVGNWAQGWSLFAKYMN